MSEENSLPGPCQYFNFLQCHLAVILWVVISPVFMVVGVCGNMMSLAVLSRRHMCHSTTSVYLRFLAVIDTLVLLVGNFREFLFNATNVDIREISDATCRFHYWLAFNLTALSGWMLSAVSIDRLISVKNPLWAKSTCTRKSAILISVAICGALFLMNSHILGYLERTEIHVSTKLPNNTITIDVICMPSIPGYKKFWEKIWPVLVISLYSALPIVCIFTSNTLLVRELTKRKTQPLTSTAENLTLNSNQRKDFKSVTRMLIAVSIFFTLISLTTCIYMNLELYLFNGKSAQDIAKRRLAWAIVSLTMYSNNAVNFILYCVSGSLFRKELKRMCLEIKTRITKCMRRRIEPQESVQSRNPRNFRRRIRDQNKVLKDNKMFTIMNAMNKGRQSSTSYR